MEETGRIRRVDKAHSLQQFLSIRKDIIPKRYFSLSSLEKVLQGCHLNVTPEKAVLGWGGIPGKENLKVELEKNKDQIVLNLFQRNPSFSVKNGVVVEFRTGTLESHDFKRAVLTISLCDACRPKDIAAYLTLDEEGEVCFKDNRGLEIEYYSGND